MILICNYILMLILVCAILNGLIKDLFVDDSFSTNKKDESLFIYYL